MKKINKIQYLNAKLFPAHFETKIKCFRLERRHRINHGQLQNLENSIVTGQKWIHFSFHVDSRQRVNAVIAHLTAPGNHRCL